LQKLYSRFPAGWPGFVLLLLRVAVGVTLIAQVTAYIPSLLGSGMAKSGACLLALSAGLALILGLLTRLFGGLAALICIALAFIWLPAPAYNFFSGNPLSLDVIIMAGACALLGPGAFSLDALLFGRRKIIIPHTPYASNS
jgi:uncharacterized membrane protein YphA (DoxX/SURF4 family)